MRRFDGSGDWPAPVSVVDVEATAAELQTAVLRRGALAFLGVIALLLIALSLATNATAF
jgi:hypothetical protein